MPQIQYAAYEASAPPALPGLFSDDRVNSQPQRRSSGQPPIIGYSPNTPPPQNNGYGRPSSRDPYGGGTLGDHIANMVRGVFDGVWGVSHTVVRVDLLRPLKYRGPIFQAASSADDNDRQAGLPPPQQQGYYPTPGAPSGAYYGQAPSAPPYGDQRGRGGGYRGSAQNFLKNFATMEAAGARLKLMQIWDFPETVAGSKMPYDINFGVGANFNMDQSKLEPKLRIKGPHVALHLVPEPELELRGKWRLGTTNLAVAARYRVPVRSAHRFWEADGGARLMVNLYNPVGTGFHLMPGGLEFDEQVVELGKHTALRVAATLHFPRRIPLPPGEQPFRISMNRLGLKARIA